MYHAIHQAMRHHHKIYPSHPNACYMPRIILAQDDASKGRNSEGSLGFQTLIGRSDDTSQSTSGKSLKCSLLAAPDAFDFEAPTCKISPVTRSSMTCERSWMTSELRRAARETLARASKKSPANMAILLPNTLFRALNPRRTSVHAAHIPFICMRTDKTCLCFV